VSSRSEKLKKIAESLNRNYQAEKKITTEIDEDFYGKNVASDPSLIERKSQEKMRKFQNYANNKFVWNQDTPNRQISPVNQNPNSKPIPKTPKANYPQEENIFFTRNPEQPRPLVPRKSPARDQTSSSEEEEPVLIKQQANVGPSDSDISRLKNWLVK
jgi:hypothetical protein